MTHRDWRPKRTGDEAFPVFPDRAGIGWSEGGHIGSMDGKRAMSGSTGKRSAIFWRHVEGVRVQGSVIGALMMRELHTRYGRQGLGYLWLILEPMILASLVASLRTFRSGGHYATGIDPVAFIIMGYTLFVMFRNIWNRSDGALESNMTLLYHRMVSVFDIIMSRVLLEGAGCLCAFIVLMAFSILVGWAHPPARPLEFIIGFALLIWWSLGFSMLICAWSYDNTTLQKFVHPVSYIMMPLSGAFFMAEWLPYKWQEPISWWPMMSIFEQLRYGWFEPASPDHRFLAYTAGCCMVLTFLGLLSIRVVRRKVQL